MALRRLHHGEQRVAVRVQQAADVLSRILLDVVSQRARTEDRVQAVADVQLEHRAPLVHLLRGVDGARFHKSTGEVILGVIHVARGNGLIRAVQFRERLLDEHGIQLLLVAGTIVVLRAGGEHRHPLL